MKIVIFILTTALLLSSCGFIKPENLKLIKPMQLNELMQQQDILLVDVHIPRQPHIGGTDFHAPFYKIDDFASKFPQNKNTPIYLYCEHGPMGNWAARTLFDMGYTHIYNLEGGTVAWKEAGFPIQTEEK